MLDERHACCQDDPRESPPAGRVSPVVTDERSEHDYAADLPRGAGEDGTSEVNPALLEDLASNLLWRIGRVSDDGPVTVRVGLASSAQLFQELPRLRSASDAEVEAAIQEGSLRVEWIGARLRG